MTEWEQRAALAEIIGWTNLKPSGRLDGQVKGYPPRGAIIGKPQEVPKIARDDMQAVMAVISKSEILVHEFMDQLRSLCSDRFRRDFECVRADPSLLAKAALLTFGKWKD